jgi:alpha-1,2-mannosyltransferase
MIVVFSPGFFYASSAFVPSSFAMYTSTLGLTCFMDWHGGAKTAPGIMWFGIGAILGWPFSGALIIPFVIEDWTIAIMMNDVFTTFRRYLDGVVRCLIVLALQVSIDTFFFRKLVFVAWNIVFYNVINARNGGGPNIFGTEPWTYYPRNLLLNFNIWFILAILAAPLLILQTLFLRQSTSKQTILRTVTFITPLYLWLAIFSLQPHKEERFMFPAYPFLALNAAISFHMVLSWLGNSSPRSLVGRIPAQVKLAIVLPLILISLNVSLLRILGTLTAYRAPLQIYSALESNTTHPSDTVCFGKDWYRLPTSHFLPNNMHAKFIKSEFDGLLPGEFHEGQTGFGMYPGAWLTPSGMNDRNIEDPGKRIDVKHCTYLVDTWMPGMKATEHEPVYFNEKQWDRLKCDRFLDVGRTHLIARTLWTPDLPFIPEKYRRKWGQHCLLKRRQV